MTGSPLRKKKFETAVDIAAAQKLLDTDWDRYGSPALCSLKDVLACARDESIPSIKRLAYLRDNAKMEVVQLSASIALLDRAWGKPHQMVMTADVTANGGPAIDYSALTGEELIVLERLLSKAGAGAAGLLSASPKTIEQEPTNPSVSAPLEG